MHKKSTMAIKAKIASKDHKKSHHEHHSKHHEHKEHKKK
jgi:hypothetical protein